MQSGEISTNHLKSKYAIIIGDCWNPLRNTEERKELCSNVISAKDSPVTLHYCCCSVSLLIVEEIRYTNFIILSGLNKTVVSKQLLSVPTTSHDDIHI